MITCRTEDDQLETQHAQLLSTY